MAKKKAVQPETEVISTQTESTPTETVQETQTPQEAAPELTQEVQKEVAKEPVKEVSKVAPKTMAELLDNPDFVIRTPRKGETVSGKITEKTRKMLMIDIGGKTEGLVVDKEFDAARDYIDQLSAGDQVEAYVLSSENDRGQILLSLKKAAMDTKWDEFTKAMDEGQVIDVKGLEVNKGGLIVVVDGIRGFIPTSQFGKEFVGNLQKLKNRKLSVKVIEVDKEKNRLIFSEKHVSEAAEMAQRAQALTSVKVGEIYEGVVSGVMPFGLFVTVSVPLAAETETAGHIEGLVHISEMSWEKVNDPHELYKVGQKIQVKVLGVEEAAGKLNLSLKQLGTDPWVDIETRYPVGTTVTGTVSRVVQFGVFVKVEPGVDGLIHTSKLSPDQQFQPTDQVTVVVESVEPTQRRMSLSAVLTEVPMGYK